jgi:glycosyltransferase involved in cell wall biosynthesis
MTGTISAIVLTKNEQQNIEKCLKSLQWCDEIVVIDDYSIYDTCKIAKKFTSRVFIHDLAGNFSEQRNFGMGKAKSDWILFVDADEEVSLSLQYEITNLIGNQFNTLVGFYIRRIDEMWGRKLTHGEAGDANFLRLAQKDAGNWKGKVHESWKIKGKTGQLQNVLYHYPHPNIFSFLREINFYSTLRAEELHEKKVKISAWQVIIYPKAKFLINYVFKLGFLDGIPGLLVAIMMSFHSFLVRGKLWQLYQQK